MRSDFRITPEGLGEDRDDGRHEVGRPALQQTQGEDPKTLVEAANPSLLQRAINEGVFSLTNSLLWLYPTHVVNLTTNALYACRTAYREALGVPCRGE